LRVLPICYENGIVNGCASRCFDFVNLAVEFYVKEIVHSIHVSVRKNADGLIKTGAFKRRLAREEAMFLRGEITKTSAGLLPVEAEEIAKWRPISMHDLRLCINLGNSYLRRRKAMCMRIMMGDLIPDDLQPEPVTEQKVNGEPGLNGVVTANGDHDDEMSVDDNNDNGWPGGDRASREALGNVLDGILSNT
jgi:transcriptional coactivator HFI1/ADA1